jgi:hypothetical protein
LRKKNKVAGEKPLPPYFYEISEKAQKSQESIRYFFRTLFIEGGDNEILYRHSQSR